MAVVPQRDRGRTSDVAAAVHEYRVVADFTLAGRTFKRGYVLAGDDPDVSLLLRVQTLLRRSLLLVRTQRVEWLPLSAGAQETVAWRLEVGS
jgi:hypothetical protein